MNNANETDIVERLQLDIKKLPDFLKKLLNPFKMLRTPNSYDWIELGLFYFIITMCFAIVQSTVSFAISSFSLYSFAVFNGLFLSLFSGFVTWIVFEYQKVEKNSALNIFYVYVVSDLFLMFLSLIPTLLLTRYFNVVGIYALYGLLFVLRVVFLCLGFEAQLKVKQKNAFLTAAIVGLFLLTPHFASIGAAYRYSAIERSIQMPDIDIFSNSYSSAIDQDLESMKLDAQIRRKILADQLASEKN